MPVEFTSGNGTGAGCVKNVSIVKKEKECKMAQIIGDGLELSVDIDIYLAFSQALIKKYGNFKMSQELHNMIIEKLADICWKLEQDNKKE